MARLRPPCEAEREGDRDGADEDHVEQDRRRGRRPEAVQRVEHAGQQRHHRHAQEIGECDLRQRDRKGVLVGVVDEPRRDEDHQPGHGEDRRDRERGNGDEEHGERLLGEVSRRRLAIALVALCEQRHERGVERALAEQAAEEVGEAEGDDVGVGDRPGAEAGGDQDVAHEAEHAAHEREPADRGEGAVESHGGRA
jgi:hypothetical protein